MREKYESLSLGALKEIAKARGIRGISTLKKSELVERMLQEDEKDKAAADKKKEETKENFSQQHQHEERKSSSREECQETKNAKAPLEQSELDSGVTVKEF